jgi:hypothetical protein
MDVDHTNQQALIESQRLTDRDEKDCIGNAVS